MYASVAAFEGILAATSHMGINGTASTDKNVQSETQAYFGLTDDPNLSLSAATEACLLDWYVQQFTTWQADYTGYFGVCAPKYCDVLLSKSGITKFVELLSTLGGLWSSLFPVALLLWFLMGLLPCFNLPAALAGGNIDGIISGSDFKASMTGQGEV